MSKKEKHSVYIKTITKTLLDIKTQLLGNKSSGKADNDLVKALIVLLEQNTGRIIFNGFPTGVEVCGSQHHGGPYPASSNGSTTSVGIDAIHRFTRVVAYQNTPAQLLPAELQNANPYNIVRRVNGDFSAKAI